MTDPSTMTVAQLKEAPELGGAKTDIADTIMGMLEVAIFIASQTSR